MMRLSIILTISVFWISLALPAQARCVILLHGLARTEFSFAVMEAALNKEGYTVVRPGYPSTEAPVGDLVKFRSS